MNITILGPITKLYIKLHNHMQIIFTIQRANDYIVNKNVFNWVLNADCEEAVLIWIGREFQK